MWPKAYWTAGYQQRFPEGYEVKNTLIAPPVGGQPSEALRELGPLSRSLSRLKDGPQIDLRLSGLQARASPLLPRPLRRGSRSDTLFFVPAGTRSLMTAGAAYVEQSS